MQRIFSCSALVLRVRSAGESNREASFLCAEEGVFTATLFGGPKSRLRSHISPFNSGTLWFYRDTSREFRKVNDFDVVSWRPGLRERYERSQAASGIAGIVLNSRGGGGAFARAVDLVCESLDALENADEACCQRLLVLFMWNWAGVLGQKPGLGFCSSCACEAAGDEVLWFVRGEGLLCGKCFHKVRLWAAASGREAGLALGPGARRWLGAVEGRPPGAVSRMSLDASSLAQAREFVRALVGDVIS
ncbi:MAG: recombination protein O N-terminal domain-containing protein [Treponema sp.]|jgi:DNA repair protein RecO (recombination protein O)|nr:recombination protein O N-terminal domain-containing protein [Treponema sp.]